MLGGRRVVAEGSSCSFPFFSSLLLPFFFSSVVLLLSRDWWGRRPIPKSIAVGIGGGRLSLGTNYTSRKHEGKRVGRGRVKRKQSPLVLNKEIN